MHSLSVAACLDNSFNRNVKFWVIPMVYLLTAMVAFIVQSCAYKDRVLDFGPE